MTMINLDIVTEIIDLTSKNYLWDIFSILLTAILAGLFAGWFAKIFSDVKDNKKEKQDFLIRLQEYAISSCSTISQIDIQKKCLQNYLNEFEMHSPKERSLEVESQLLLHMLPSSPIQVTCINNNDIIKINKLINNHHHYFNNELLMKKPFFNDITLLKSQTDIFSPKKIYEAHNTFNNLNAIFTDADRVLGIEIRLLKRIIILLEKVYNEDISEYHKIPCVKKHLLKS